MSDMPPVGPPPLGPAGFPSSPVSPGPGPGPWPPMCRPSRWPTFVTLLVSLAALGFAVAAWLRPMPAPSAPTASAPTYTDQQVADAKAKVCEAYAKVRRAVDMNWTRNGGNDPTAQLAVAVNMRQVYIAGSAYMQAVLADEPATPSDLTREVHELSDLYEIISLDGLASDDSLPAHDDANEAGVAIERLCK